MTIDDYQDLNVKLQQEEQKIAEIKKNVDFTVLDQYKERVCVAIQLLENEKIGFSWPSTRKRLKF